MSMDLVPQWCLNCTCNDSIRARGCLITDKWPGLASIMLLL